MRNEFDKSDPELLTTEETTAVVELHHQREQEKLAERERLAGSPRLKDLADLTGKNPEELLSLLKTIRGEKPREGIQDPHAEIVLTPEEAERVVELVGWLERVDQEELERRIQLTSVSDLSRILQISESEVSYLLRSIRRKSSIDPDETAKYEPVPPELLQHATDKFRQRIQKRRTRNYSIVLALISVCAFALLIDQIVSAVDQNHRTSPTQNNTIWQPPRKITVLEKGGTPFNFRPSDTLKETEFEGTFTIPAPPLGWTISVRGLGGMYTVHSTDTQKSNEAVTKQKLKRSCIGLVDLITSQQAIQDRDRVPGLLIPLQPTQLHYSHSDLRQGAIVEISDRTIKRQRYLPYIERRPQTPQVDAIKDREDRLTEMLDLKSKPHVSLNRPKIELLDQYRSLTPKGMRVNVITPHHFFQVDGESDWASRLDEKMTQQQMRQVISDIVKNVYLKISKSARSDSVPPGVIDSTCWIQVNTLRSNISERFDFSTLDDIEKLMITPGINSKKLDQMVRLIKYDREMVLR